MKGFERKMMKGIILRRRGENEGIGSGRWISA
jgi:hypothetical protein